MPEERDIWRPEIDGADYRHAAQQSDECAERSGRWHHCQKKYTEKTEVKTETKRNTEGLADSEYEEETTVKTERTVEKEKEKDPVVIIEEN